MDDIERLVEIEAEEGAGLEFKRRIDALKDLHKEVCAFANHEGGEIVIGVDEKDGRAASPAPLEGVSTDKERLRLLDALRSSITPPIPRIQIEFVEVLDGHVIVLRVPKSRSAPHMTNGKRIYVRDVNQSRPMEIDELRAAFLGAEIQAERLRKFHRDRCHEVTQGSARRSLQSQRCLVVHVMPLDALSAPRRFDATSLNESMTEDRAQPPPQRLTSYSFIDFDGVGRYSGSDKRGRVSGYIHVNRQGAIETVDCEAVKNLVKDNAIYLRQVEMSYSQAVLISGKILDSIGLSGPYAIQASLMSIHGTHLGERSHMMEDVLKRDSITTHELVLERLADEQEVVAEQLRPSFDSMWNAYGVLHSESFDEHGKWRRQ